MTTWEKVMAHKKDDTRHIGVANNLTDDEIETILATIDFFGGNYKQAYSDLSSRARFAPQYRVFDFLGMCVMGNRIESEDAVKVLVHSFLKSNGDIDLWIQDLRETDYQVDTSWESLELSV